MTSREAGVAACWSQPISAANGEVLGAMALYDTTPSRPTQYQMDGLEISARMVGLAAEREILEAQLQNAAKMEALGVMVGGLAHDFNNLLGVVLGSTDLLRARTQDANLHPIMDDITSAVRNATGLCNQMLAYAGRSTISIETVDISAVIKDLSTLLHASLSKKVTLRENLTAGLHVTADPNQLRQVLLNLITNGAESIGNQEGEVVVATRATTSPTAESLHDLVELLVADTGCGMSADLQKRVFDPFLSTKAEGRRLGLAAVKGIVDTHEWQLRMRSTPGVGTVFTLSLPRAAPGGASIAQSRAPLVTGHSRILVVDDEPLVRKVVSGMLKHAGIEVLQASDGVEAIELFRVEHGTLDGVVLDLNMPKLDGEEVFRALRKIDPNARVVLMSGFAEQEVVDRFRGAGVSGVLQKPVSMSTLLLRVGEMRVPRAGTETSP